MQEVLKPLFLEPGQLAVLELDTKRLLRGIILDNSSGHSLRTNLAAGASNTAGTWSLPHRLL